MWQRRYAKVLRSFYELKVPLIVAYSLYFSLFIVRFIFLFFFLLIFQILVWKSLSLKIFESVFRIYKFVLVGAVIFVEIFFVNLSRFRANVFFELTLWFNLGPYFCLDPFSCIFFVFAVTVSWSIIRFGVDYMADEQRVRNFLFFLLIFLLLIFVLAFSGNFLMLFVR